MIPLRIPNTPATVSAAVGYALSYMLAGVFCAVPIASLITATTGHVEGGDGRLFEPGGVFLIEHIRLNAPALLAAMRTAAVQLVIASVLLLGPLTAVVVTLIHPARRIQMLPVDVLRHLPSFVLLGGLSLLTRVVSTSLLLLLGGLVLSVVASSVGEKSTDGLLAVALLLFVALHGAISVCFDFARSAVVARPVSALRSLPLAVECLLRHPSAHLAVRFLTAALGWSGPLLAAALIAQFDVRELSGWSLLLTACLHQCSVLWLLLGHYWWLSYAADAVQRLPGLLSLEQPDDRAAQTDVQDAPNPNPDASRGV